MTIQRTLLLNAIKQCLYATTKDANMLGSHCVAFTGTALVSFNDWLGVSIPLATEFQATVEAQKLYKTVNAYKTETIDLTFKDRVLTLKSGKSKHTLKHQEVGTADRITIIKKLTEEGTISKLPLNFTSLLKGAVINHDEKALMGIFTEGNDIVATDNTLIIHSTFEGNVNPFRLSNKSAIILNMFSVDAVQTIEAWCSFSNSEGTTVIVRTLNKEGYPLDAIKSGISSFVAGEVLAEYKYDEKLNSSLSVVNAYCDAIRPICSLQMNSDSVTISTETTEGSAVENVELENVGEVKTNKVFNCIPTELSGLLKHVPRTFGVRKGYKDREAFVTWDDSTIRILGIIGEGE